MRFLKESACRFRLMHSGVTTEEVTVLMKFDGGSYGYELRISERITVENLTRFLACEICSGMIRGWSANDVKLICVCRE